MIYADVHVVEAGSDTGWLAEIISTEPLRHVIVTRSAPTEEGAWAEAERVLELIA